MENKDLKKIRKEAKGLIDSFAKELEKVKEKVEDVNVERDEDRRKEGEGFSGSEDFKKDMLENAPKTENGSIKSEKGKWVK